jgi:hypothetical protein
MMGLMGKLPHVPLMHRLSGPRRGMPLINWVIGPMQGRKRNRNPSVIHEGKFLEH